MRTEQEYQDREAKMDEAMSLETSTERLLELINDNSRSVRETAQQNIDIRNGGKYNRQTGKVEF